MMNIQKAVIARAKMCETDLDRVTSTNNIGLFLDETRKKYQLMLSRVCGAELDTKPWRCEDVV